jgi:hypothetical protein
MQRFFNVSKEIPLNRKLLNTLALTSYMNDDYFLAESYYKRLVNVLESDRSRIANPLPDNIPAHRDLIARLMVAKNNTGVTLNALAGQTGRSVYRSSALALFSEAARLWDMLERDQQTLIRPRPIPGGPTISPPYLNLNNVLNPLRTDDTVVFPNIDSDVLDTSAWVTTDEWNYKREAETKIPF